MQGLMTICHDARKGGYIGSHWPKHLAPLLYSTQPETLGCLIHLLEYKGPTETKLLPRFFELKGPP